MQYRPIASNDWLNFNNLVNIYSKQYPIMLNTSSIKEAQRNIVMEWHLRVFIILMMRSLSVKMLDWSCSSVYRMNWETINFSISIVLPYLHIVDIKRSRSRLMYRYQISLFRVKRNIAHKQLLTNLHNLSFYPLSNVLS